MPKIHVFGAGLADLLGLKVKKERKMKLEIYEPNPKQKIDFKLALEKDDDCVYLKCVDESGVVISSSYLLRIDNDGTLHRMTGLNKDLGFQLDDDARIKEY